MQGDVGSRFDRIDQHRCRHDGDIADPKSDVKLIKWMVSFNIALAIGVLAKLLVG